MRAAAILFAITLTIVGRSAVAQEVDGPPAADVDAARALFEEGVAADQAGRVDIARDMFRESFAIEPRLNTAINLAVVLTRLGQLLEAEGLLEELGQTHPDQSEEDARQIAQILELIGDEIATIDLRVSGPAEGEIHVRVDGARVASPGTRTASLRVDPGRHTIVAIAGDGRRAEEAVQVERGQRLELRLSLPPPADDLLRTSSIEDEGTASVWRSPWLWTGVFLFVAAAITVPIVIATSANQPATDPVWGRAEVP